MVVDQEVPSFPRFPIGVVMSNFSECRTPYPLGDRRPILPRGSPLFPSLPVSCLPLLFPYLLLPLPSPLPTSPCVGVRGSDGSDSPQTPQRAPPTWPFARFRASLIASSLPRPQLACDTTSRDGGTPILLRRPVPEPNPLYVAVHRWRAVT